MSDDDCPGADGLVCVRGWLYSQINMMIFPANKKCPVCNPPKTQLEHFQEQIEKYTKIPEVKKDD